MAPFVPLRLAILSEFVYEAPAANLLPEGIDNKGDLEATLPRLGIEQVLSDSVVRQGLQKPRRVPVDAGQVSWCGSKGEPRLGGSE